MSLSVFFFVFAFPVVSLSLARPVYCPILPIYVCVTANSCDMQ